MCYINRTDDVLSTPARSLIDKQGVIRYTRFGEG